MHLSYLHLTAVVLAVAHVVPTLGSDLVAQESDGQLEQKKIATGTNKQLICSEHDTNNCLSDMNSGHETPREPERIRGARAAGRRGEPGEPGGAGEPGEPNGRGGTGGYGGKGGDGGYIGPGDLSQGNGWKDRNVANGGDGGHGGTGGNGNYGADGGPGGIGGKGGDGGTIDTAGGLGYGINIANGGHGGDGGFGRPGGYGGAGGNGGNIGNGELTRGGINIANGGDGGTAGGRGGNGGTVGLVRGHGGNGHNAVSAGTGLKMDLTCLLLATIFISVAHAMATRSFDLIAQGLNGQLQ